MQDDIMESLKVMEAQSREKDFSRWKEALKKTGAPRHLRSGLSIDIATSPIFWFRQAQELLCSSLDIRRDFEGLPYTTFLLATEWFLKGLWILQQHPQWISLDRPVSREERANLDSELRGLTDKKNHDLEKMAQKVRSLFSDDEHVVEFLDVLDGIIREHYWPFYRDGENWVACRYPTWVYDENTNKPLPIKSESMLRKVDVYELFKRLNDHLWRRYIEPVILPSMAQTRNAKEQSLKNREVSG